MVNCLAHHGILGQKWGVRRFQNENGSLTKEGKKRYREEMYDHYLSQEKNDGFFARSRSKSKAKTATSIANTYGKIDVAIDKKLKKLSDGIKLAKANGDGKTANRLSKKWISQRYSQIYAKDLVKNIDQTVIDYMDIQSTVSIATIGFGIVGGFAAGTAVLATQAYRDRDKRASLKEQARSEYMKKYGK